MEHSDFSSDISSDDFIGEESDIEHDDEHHEHEQKSKYLNINVVAFKFSKAIPKVRTQSASKNRVQL